MAVQGDEGGPLETRGVRTVDDDLPHEVDFARGLRFEQERDLESNIESLRVRWMGRFFVRLDQTGVRCRLVDEGEAPLRLLDRRGVNLAELGLRRPKPSTEPLSTRGIDEDGRVLAEQLVRRELLVDLQSDLQAEGPIVHGIGNRRRGINPSLAGMQPRRLSAGFPPARRFESPTARVPAPATRSERRPP